MLCRWDMQEAPPDILVTNYSMLEYMLVRPIESPIFAKTRDWLAEAQDHTITMVLDEAHTYTGAKGTEVACLVRRLKERLGLSPGSSQFQAIATSTSVPATGQADEADRLVGFAADLFGEPLDSFTLIHAGVADQSPGARKSTARSFSGFSRTLTKPILGLPYASWLHRCACPNLTKPTPPKWLSTSCWRATKTPTGCGRALPATLLSCRN